MHSVEFDPTTLSDSVFCLDGDDLYWRDLALSKLKALVPAGETDVGIRVYERLDGFEELTFLLGSFSFNEGCQLIVIEDGGFKPDKKELKNFLELLGGDISPYKVAFVDCKFLSPSDKKVAVTVDCDRLKRPELVAYVEKLFGRAGIDRDAVQKLVDYTELNMAKISTEREKLLCYAEGRRVTAEDVEFLVSESIDLQVYIFVNSVVAGKKAQAYKDLTKLMRRGESKSLILASLIKQYRRLLYSALSPLPDAELAKLFGVKEYAIKKCRETRGNQRELKSKLDMLCSCEFRSRNGEMSEASAFDLAVSKLLS